MSKAESPKNNGSLDAIGCFDTRELGEKPQIERVEQNWADAPIERVIHHLVREHQSWRIKDFPMIEYLFDCLEGSRSPKPPSCLVALRRAFYKLRAEMEAHMSREENVLFPALATGVHESEPTFGSIRNPIAMLEEDHDHDDQLLADMRAAASGYELPESASESLRVLFRELRALEASMHAHTSVERSILFSRALKGEHVEHGEHDPAQPLTRP